MMALFAALRKLKTKHPKSSLTRQANWYIPWLYYLKGNHQKAHDLFEWAISGKIRRLPRRIGKNQISYWRAMCLLKMGKKKDAEKILSTLAQDEFIGYYAAASVQRLKELAGNRPLAFVGRTKRSITVHEKLAPVPGANRESSGEYDCSTKVDFVKFKNKRFFLC